MGNKKRMALFAAGAVVLVALGIVGAYAGGKASEERQALLDPGDPPVDSLADCPWGEASCVLALSIERALQLDRVDAIVDFAKPAFYECPGRPQQSAGEPFPLCEGSPGFTRLEGYPVARRVSDSNLEAQIVNEEGLQVFLQDFVDWIDPSQPDKLGEGKPRLYAFGCPERATRFVNVSCARLAIILSAATGDGGPAQRELIIFWAVGLFRGETLPVTEVWTGELFLEETPILFSSGGLIADLGEIYVIDQSLRGAAP